MSKKATKKISSSKAKKKATAKKAPAKKKAAKKPAPTASHALKKSTKKSAPAKPAKKTAPKSSGKAAKTSAPKKKVKTAAKTVKKAAAKKVTKQASTKAVRKTPAKKKTVSKKAPKVVTATSPKTVKKPNAQAIAAGKNTQRKSFLKEMKVTLLSELQELNEFIRKMKAEHMSLHGGRNADTTDTASEALDDELALQIAEIEARRRMMIRQALEHIEDGTFGTCEACSDAPLNLCSTCPYIPPMRLKAVPSARLCIDCKQLEENFGPEHLDLLKEGALAKAPA